MKEFFLFATLFYCFMALTKLENFLVNKLGKKHNSLDQLPTRYLLNKIVR